MGDENHQDKYCPDSVKLNRLANGKDVVDTVTLNSENVWKKDKSSSKMREWK